MTARTLKLPSSYDVKASASERLLASIGRNVVVADLRERKRLWSAHPLSHPSSADFSSDDGVLAVKSTWGEVALLNCETGEKLVSIRPKVQDEGPPVRFAATDQFIVDGSWSGNIRVRQVTDLSVLECFHYKDEMIGAVSSDADRKAWLFAHKPKAVTGSSEPRQPYVTIWDWPLREPKARIEPGLDILYSAELAPSGKHIAVIGFSRADETKELRLITLEGALVATTTVAAGGTGSRLRWSPDSTLIGTVGKGEFLVFAARTLAAHAQFQEPYPSDLAFIGGNSELVLGSWTAGRIVNLPPPGDA